MEISIIAAKRLRFYVILALKYIKPYRKMHVSDKKEILLHLLLKTKAWKDARVVEEARLESV